MIITCGIKLTHDGAVALFEDNRLIFSVEMEKINNNARFSHIKDLKSIEEVLNSFGYKLEDVDKFVVDGWGNNEQDILDFYPGLSIINGISHLKIAQDDFEYKLPVAGYFEDKVVNNTLTPLSFDGLKILKGEMDYYYDSDPEIQQSEEKIQYFKTLIDIFLKWTQF